MRIFKLIIALLILGFISLFIYQNQAAFSTKVPFQLSTIGTPAAWNHTVSTLLFVVGGLGFLLGILLMLRPYFNVRRKLAHERQARTEQVQVISKSDVAPLTGSAETTEKTKT